MIDLVKDTVTRARPTLVADFAGMLMLAALTLGVLNLPAMV